MNGRLAIVVAAVLISAELLPGACLRAAESSSVEKAISRATAWLVSQQSADGGWHSETYGAYRGGVGTTAIAVQALCEGDCSRSEACQRGAAFLTTRRDEGGFVVAPDGSSDNALYATAITVRLLAHQRTEDLADNRLALERALSETQFLEGDPGESPDHGGWAALVTAQDEVSPETPCNISATKAVLAANLRSCNLRAAEAFVRSCQNFGPETHNDGGFFFTPHVDHPLNKMSAAATPAGRLHPVSYFPATCDGIVCMNSLASPEFKTSPMSKATARALRRLETLSRPSLATVAPSPDGPQPSPIDGLYFYSAAAFADVWERFPDHRSRLRPIRDEFVKTIVERQRQSGEWINPVKTMREDDPLIATSLAIIALRKLSAE